MVEKYKQATAKELDMILTDATKRGKRIIEEAEKKSKRLHEEIAHLKDMKRNLQLELKLMINGHMKMLENIDNIEDIADLKKRHIREEDKRQFVA
jgi:cell division septum initiation protein DivIVA